MRFARPYLAVVPLLGLALATPGIGWACSCTNIPDQPRAILESDAIFTGVVTAIEAPPPPYDWPEFEIVVVRVYAWWKGGAATTARVWNGVHDGVCGLPLDVGSEWLIYACPNYGPPLPGLLGTHSCWRVRPLEFAGDDLSVLGPAGVTAGITRSWGRVKQLYR